jgi:carbohydrate-binding DOMON domain-containing protein
VRKKVGDKVKGAAQFFVTDTVTSPDTAKETVAVTDTAKETDTVEVTDTVTSPLIKPTDIYVRKVCYLLEHQAKYVVKMAKKYKVTEAEIMRIAVEELKKSGKI